MSTKSDKMPCKKTSDPRGEGNKKGGRGGRAQGEEEDTIAVWRLHK